MPGLFEQFPHTNLHELNLDWIINMFNQFKEELEDSAVLSVNGQTGHVTLYESENVILPALPEGVDQWRLVRMMDGQYAGVLFYNGNVYLQRGNETMRLLTQEDIPSSSGVVSWNGLTGVVTVTGEDIPVDNTADANSIEEAITNETIERVNADNELQNSIQNEIYYKSGDIINNYYFGYGYLTSGQKRLTVFIPTPKLIPAGTKTLMTGSRFEMRGIEGYIGDFTSGNNVELVDNPDYTVTVSKENDGRVLQLDINHITAYSTPTNNTPIMIRCAPLKISFE